jgi:hypothetical protein
MLPTDRWLRVLLAPALVFIATAVDRNYQTDLWHHLARGRAILEDGRLLDRDRFTFTIPGQPFQDSNWGWQVANYGLYRLGGLPLVQTANAAVLAAAMAVLLGLCRRRSGSLIASAGVCVLVFFGLWQMLLIRPQTWSLLLFVLLYAALEGARRRPVLLAVPPLILAAWANVHGGFPVGLALVGCFAVAAAGERMPNDQCPMTKPRPLVIGHWSLGIRSPWVLCLAASVLATLVNPYGWHIYEYVLLTSRTASGRGIDEWLPPGLHLLAGKVWVLSVLLLVGLFAGTGRKTAEGRWGTWRDLCLVACFLPPACGSVRMVAWWLLATAPILVARLADAWPALRREDEASSRPSPGAAVAVAALAAAAVLSLPWLEHFNPVFALPGRAHRTETDLQAVAHRLASEAGAGRIYTRFSWGEYLGWSLSGKYTVFMDGRIEIFPDEVWATYNAVARGRADWDEVLAGYAVDWLLLDASGHHQDLLPLVERSPGWRQVAREGDAVLFTRRPAEGRSEPRMTRMPTDKTQAQE